MWPILVEFHSASSECSWRKKEEERKKNPGKYKSADNYIGWTNKVDRR